jgi:hypothetical protein
MKRLFVIFLLSTNVYAIDSLNLSIPISPGQYQSDHIRAENMECSMAIGSGTNLEFGVLGIANNNNNNGIIGANSNSNPNNSKQVGVYGRIIIPIGAPKNRLDCNQLYQLELRKRQMEMMRLNQELESLRRMQFENKGGSK